MGLGLDRAWEWVDRDGGGAGQGLGVGGQGWGWGWIGQCVCSIEWGCKLTRLAVVLELEVEWVYLDRGPYQGCIIFCVQL